MKRIPRTAVACGAVILAGAALVGCSPGSATSSSGSGGIAIGGVGGGGASVDPSCSLTPGAPVALAIGARSNNPTPSLTASVTAALNGAITAKKLVSIVRVDGSPTSVFSQAYTPTGANPEAQKENYDDYVDTLNQILAGTASPASDIRAQVPQADLLDALAVAGGELRGAGGGNLVVIDSGLQTMDPLNFTTGLLADDPQTIVSFLKNANELPDLSGLSVEFSDLGWTAPPQPSLSIAERARVTQIWAAIATAAGASCVFVDPTPPQSRTELPGLPSVSVVTPPKQPNAVVSCSVTNLNDANNVGFEFASTTFRDPAGARATLQRLARVMISTGESVTLTGATSSEGSNEFNQQLSLQRAQAVEAVLIQLGVPANRITAIGDGSHLPGRLNDKGPNGQLLIGPAIQNRKVVAKLSGASCPAA
jgi:OOP family OmpA-OmpF porin